MGERIYIPEARIKYARQLFTPKKVNPTDAEAKYGSTFIVRSDHPVIAQITEAINNVIAQTYPGGQLPANFRSPPWYDGTKDGFPGFTMIRAYAKQKPLAVEGDLRPILDSERLYSGCYVNASLSVYTYPPKPTPGITFGLDGVQFVREGDRLDGRPTAEQMFQKIEGAPPPAAGAMPTGFGPAPATTPGPGPALAASGPAPGTPGNGTSFLD